MRKLVPLPVLMLLAACTDPHTPAALELAAAQSSHLAGAAAPGFTLTDQDGKKTALADYRGKWVVLYFFAHGDTPGCRCGANDFTNLLLKLENLNAPLLAINDGYPEDNLYSRDQYDLQITVLSDPENQVMAQYKIRDSVNDPITRQTFLIDPAGRIAYHWPVVFAEGHVDRVNQKIKELQARP